LVLGLGQFEARGWGGEGHRIVALIAINHLEPGARDKIEQLLQASGSATIADVKVEPNQFGSIADMASWADAYRFSHSDSEPWHFVHLPISVPAYDRSRDCADRQCVIAKIADFTKVLGDEGASDVDRAVALRFIVHFVGDVHQPLHSADNDDHGGNGVKV